MKGPEQAPKLTFEKIRGVTVHAGMLHLRRGRMPAKTYPVITARMAKLDWMRATPGIRLSCSLWMRS